MFRTRDNLPATRDKLPATCDTRRLDYLFSKRTCTCSQSDMKFERSAIDPAALSLRIVVFFFSCTAKIKYFGNRFTEH